MVTRSKKATERNMMNRIWMGLAVLYAVYFSVLFVVFRAIQDEDLATDAEEAGLDTAFLNRIEESSNTELLNLSALYSAQLLLGFVIGGLLISWVIQFVAKEGFNRKISLAVIFNAYLWINIALWLLLVTMVSPTLLVLVVILIAVAIFFTEFVLRQRRRR